MTDSTKKREVQELTKKRYIKSNISILSDESTREIYNMIKSECGGAIRETRNSDGVYVDLDKIINKDILNNIYLIIKKRKDIIKRK
jgi:hypothetical protein